MFLAFYTDIESSRVEQQQQQQTDAVLLNLGEVCDLSNDACEESTA